MPLALGSSTAKQYRVKITNFCGDDITSTPVTVGICGETTTVAAATVNDSTAASGQTVIVSSAGITSGNYTSGNGFIYTWEVSTNAGSTWDTATATTGSASGNTLVVITTGSIAVPPLNTAV